MASAVERKHLEMYHVVWLNSDHSNQTDEFQEAKTRLQKLFNQVKIFDDLDQCEAYIRSVSNDERIIGIFKDQLGQDILHRIHGYQQIYAIYLYGLSTAKKDKMDGRTNFEKVNQIGDNEIDEYVKINVFL